MRTSWRCSSGRVTSFLPRFSALLCSRSSACAAKIATGSVRVARSRPGVALRQPRRATKALRRNTKRVGRCDSIKARDVGVSRGAALFERVQQRSEILPSAEMAHRPLLDQFAQGVAVAGRAESAGERLGLLAKTLELQAGNGSFQHAERGAQAAQGDTQLVDGFGIVAGAQRRPIDQKMFDCPEDDPRRGLVEIGVGGKIGGLGP